MLRACLLAVAVAVVWGYDSGLALADVKAPHPETFQQLFTPHLPSQPHVSTIPSHIAVRYLLE